MSNLYFDFVAIDTNVFGHLVTKPVEECDHIEHLLVWLRDNKTRLIVDSKNRITDEYYHTLVEHLKILQHPLYEDILEYWLTPNSENMIVTVDHKEDLMQEIKKIVKIGRKSIDSIFVYVAIQKNRTLVTNDRKDIIDVRRGDSERRSKLLKLAREFGFERASIYDSKEAIVKICSPSKDR